MRDVSAGAGAGALDPDDDGVVQEPVEQRGGGDRVAEDLIPGLAALAGLAPVARESGQRDPTRKIGGGRPTPRAMLCLAALQASLVSYIPCMMRVLLALESWGAPCGTG
jgi:hypothetical protein